MSVLLVLVIVLPIVLLGLGVVLGLGLARLGLPGWLGGRCGHKTAADVEECTETKVRQASGPTMIAVHVVASATTPSAPAVPQQWQPSDTGTGTPSASPLSSPLPSSPLGSRPMLALPDFASDSPLPSPAASPVGFHKRGPSLELGRLMRAGTSVLSQVMDDLDTRTAIMRLMSDGVNVMPSPQAGTGHMLSPSPSIMPAGEVHMDEIDLLECIGKGGYGAVYKASWRQAPVAVKYIVCRTDDHDSLGRAIREVVLSKKMSHPNVVQCYSWTVLTEPDKQQEPGRAIGPLPSGATRRSLDTTFVTAQPPQQQHLQDSLVRQHSLRRIMELPTQEETSGADSPMPKSPFADAAAAAPSAAAVGPAVAADEMATVFAMRISSKQSTESYGTGSGKLQPQPDSNNSSPVIPAVRPADLPALAASGGGAEAAALVGFGEEAAAPTPHGGGASVASPQPAAVGVHSNMETPAAAQCGYPAGSFEEALLVQFQQLASEMYLSRSASLKLSHQATNSSSFSDVNHDFMLASSSRGETQQSAPESGWASRRDSPGSSLGGTPSAAAAERGDSNNPFRRSRLSRNTSSMAAVAGEVLAAGVAAVEPAAALDSEGSGGRLPPQQQQDNEPAGLRFVGRETAQQQPPPQEPADAPPVASQGSSQQQAQHTQEPAAAEAPGMPSAQAPVCAPQREEATGNASAPASEASLAPLPGSSGSEAPEPTSLALRSNSRRCSTQEGLPCPADPVSQESTSSELNCTSSVTVAGWEQCSRGCEGATAARTGDTARAAAAAHNTSGSGREAVGGSRPQSPPGMRTTFQQWRAEAGAHVGLLAPVPRLPSRLGPRPVIVGDLLVEGSRPDTGRSSLAALPPGSPPVGRGLGQRGSYGSLAALQDEAGGRLTSPRGSPGAGRAGCPSLPPELQVASRENSRSAKKQRRVDEVIDSELMVESRTDSFNSEEGFGSPVRNRCGGVKSVFELEGLHLSPQEALMVVVMEFCDLGALHKALRRKAFVPHGKWTFQTTYRALLRTAQEIAKGMEYIHDFDIVHGDLKPGNVLLKTHKVDRRGYIAKVSDFGLSRPINIGETHISMGNALGTIAYTAPETFSTNIAKKPSDVYAFGIILWEMFYCKELYEGLLDGQICVGVTDGSLRPEFDDTCPLPYRRLAERCWHQDPNQRPPFKEIVRELVQIEVDFRNLTHRPNSKVSIPGSGQNSAANSRPPSPDILARSRSRAADADFARVLL